MPADPKQRYFTAALRNLFGLARLIGLDLTDVLAITDQEIVKLRDDYVDADAQEQEQG